METATILPPGPAERLCYRIGQLPAVTGLGRSSLYGEIKAGRLMVFKIGKATFAHRDDVHAWLDSHRGREAA